MGHTACTEPHCLYKDALYLYLYTNFGARTALLFTLDRQEGSFV
jgi:hypothetical protein